MPQPNFHKSHHHLKDFRRVDEQREMNEVQSHGFNDTVEPGWVPDLTHHLKVAV